MRQVENRTAVVEKRPEKFAERASTAICEEIPQPENPFVAARVLWQGYDSLELMRHRSLVDVVFLLLKGELPTDGQRKLLEKILIILANPGPRHPSVRGVMNASVSKTKLPHLLPIGLVLAGGEQQGSTEVLHAMRFLRENMHADAADAANRVRHQMRVDSDSRWTAAGFGSRFSAIDSYAEGVVKTLSESNPKLDTFSWGSEFCHNFPDIPVGWLMTGVAAAAFVELDFSAELGSGLYQMAVCPGLLAHGLEQARKPVTDMPFVSDDNYHYQGREF